MDLNITLAVYGGIVEGDPMDEKGTNKEYVRETLYPPLVDLADHLGFNPEDMYKTLVDKGFVVFMCGERLVVATHAYTHDNNTTRTLQ
jgi:hypothetical protein